MPTPVSSRCSQGGYLTFAWWGRHPASPEMALNVATAAFAEIMRAHGRVWDVYSWAIAKAEFRGRVQMAMRGELVPVDHVKSVVRGEAVHMFEIRWTVPVLERRPSGIDVEHDVEVRLYHAEPPRFATHFVGLHVHEKAVVPGDEVRTRDLQNAEIDIAIDRYDDGDPSDWGIV